MRAASPLAASVLLVAAALPARAGSVPLQNTAGTLRTRAGKPGLALTALVLTARMMSYKASRDAAAGVPARIGAGGGHDKDMAAQELEVKKQLTDYLYNSGGSAPIPTLDRARQDLAVSVSGLSKVISNDPLPADPAGADAFHQKALDGMYQADQAVENLEYARRGAVPILDALAMDAAGRYMKEASKAKPDPKELARLSAQAAEVSRERDAVDRGLSDAKRLGEMDSVALAALVPDSTALALASALGNGVGDVQQDLASAQSVQSVQGPDQKLVSALGYAKKTLGRSMREWSTIGGNYMPSDDGTPTLPAGDRHSAIAVTTADRDTISALAVVNQVAQLTPGQ